MNHTPHSHPTPRRPPDRFQDHRRPIPPELRRYVKTYMKGISEPSDEQAMTIAQALYQEDPLADEWVSFAAEQLDRELSERWVHRAIEEGIQNLYRPPAPLIALFEQLEHIPLWLDESLLGVARQTVRRSGPLGNWLLVNVALMGGYRYEGVIQPLLLTGRLADYAPQRLADTTQFVQDVLSEEGLKRGARGYRAIIRVRLLHAHIRYHLRHHPQWSTEQWGAPVNQADMLATQLLFSLSYLITGRALGLRFNERESLSVIHLWRYVGVLLGVTESLLPSDEREARRLFYLIGMTQSVAGPEAAVLGRALHEVPQALAEGWVERVQAQAAMKIRAGVSRLFLGDEALCHLGVPLSAVSYAVIGVVPLIYTLEQVRSKLPGFTTVAAHLGGRWQDKYTQNLLKRSGKYQNR